MSPADVRPLTQSDLDEVVELHVICFTPETNFAMRLGRGFIRATYDFFLADSKGFAFGAWYRGQLIGTIFGRLDYYATDLNRYRSFAACKALMRRPWTLLRRGISGKLVSGLKTSILASRKILASRNSTRGEEAKSSPPGDTATVASLCVHPDYGQLKATDRLLWSAERFCRDNKMKYLRAGVPAGNLKSRFAYRRRNYQRDEVASDERSLFYYLELGG